MKNRIHQELESSCIKISSVLSDIFGKSGRYILDGLLEGKTIDEILVGIKSKKRRKKDHDLREAIKNSLDPAQILVIRICLELMEEIQKKIDNLDTEIMSRIERMKEDVEFACQFLVLHLLQPHQFLQRSGIIVILQTEISLLPGVGLYQKYQNRQISV
jgi:hypothetical protein